MIIFTENIDDSLKQSIKTFPLITLGENADEIIEKSEHIIVTIESSLDIVIGYIILEPASMHLPPNIHYIEVLKEFQRRGLGTQLLQKMLQYLKKIGEKRVILYSTNKSRSFFEKHKFVGKYNILELSL